MENKKVLPLLFLVMFLVMVGFGIIIPVLPFLAEQVGGTPTQLGFLMAVYSLMQLFFAPVWGKVSDRFGRKPVMLIGILGLAISFFIMAAADSLWLMFVARIIGGVLSSANMPTTMAYVADITTEEDRGKGMGIIGAATGLGFIFGPAIGGLMSKSSLNTPFLFAGILSALTFLLVLFVLKESLPADQRGGMDPTGGSMWKKFTGAVSILLILQFTVSLSMAGLEATFAYFAAKKAGIDTIQLGYIFMIMGFGSAIVQGGLIGIMTRKWGEGRVIQIGLFVSVIGFILILFSHNFWTATIFLTIFGLGNGVIRPAVTALLTKTSTGGHGGSTGLLSSFDSLGRIIGPPLGGLLYSVTVGLPYISGAILTLGALLLYQVYHVKVRRTQAL